MRLGALPIWGRNFLLRLIKIVWFSVYVPQQIINFLRTYAPISPYTVLDISVSHTISLKAKSQILFSERNAVTVRNNFSEPSPSLILFTIFRNSIL